MYLLPNTEELPPIYSSPDSHKTPLQGFSAYELPSVEVLIKYFHAAAGFPVCTTWLNYIKVGYAMLGCISDFILRTVGWDNP